MKTKLLSLLSVMPLIGLLQGQTTQTYTDSTTDLSSTVGVGDFPHLNISSVVVTVDAAATNITFRINLQGSPMDTGGTNWGKYLVGVRSAGGGATTGNGWGRPINFAPGMTRWIGTWADAGSEACGGQTFVFSGGWTTTSNPTVTKDSTGITITTSVAALGLDPGETFAFDVYTSGGGGSDSAVDALSASGASITSWGSTYTTNVASASTNAAKTFTMPGTANFATWITQFGLALADQDPSDDPDGDTLTNQQEYDLDLGLNPSLADTDGDLLDDNVETGTGIYVSTSDTGSLPGVFDTDGDGYSDGNEVVNAAYGYVSNPNIKNYTQMTVPGSFNTPAAWTADSNANTPATDMTQVDTSITGQYEWALKYNFTLLGAFEYKYAAGSWANNWGNSGNNFAATIQATGFHTFTFNNATLAQSFVRTTFPDVTSYLDAYALSAGTDTDGDGVLNENEFAANTDPNNSDTDGDGALDGVDANPLQASRNVVFTVDMTVQEALGNFNPTTGSVVVKFFTGNLTGLPDLALTEVGNTGIYTGTLSNLVGASGNPSGGYKFFNTTAGAPNSGYEYGSDRTFLLGTANATQTLGTVYFSDESSLPGYSSWATTNAGSQSADQDYDGDGVANGVEYFMGQTGSSFTTNPVPNGNLITWPRNSSATGVSFRVLSSTNLTTWTDVTSAADTSDPAAVKYTLPTGNTRLFVKLEVTVP